MDVDIVSDVLTSRLIALGEIDTVSFADQVIAVVRDWMQSIADTLPPKKVVLQAVTESLDRAFAGIDMPGPDVIVEPLLTSAILTLVAYAYDQIVGDGVSV